MNLRVGLTGSDLKSLDHRVLRVRGTHGLSVILADGAVEGTASGRTEKPVAQLPAGGLLEVKAVDGLLVASGLPALAGRRAARIKLTPGSGQALICLPGLNRSGTGANPCYRGTLELAPAAGAVRAVLITGLDAYVRAVLASEIPGSYRLEAIKAQAVAARSYGIRPRVSHDRDGFNVCDSYLCCQHFAGTTGDIAPNYAKAIEQTAGEVLTYADRPALALFSSCAGGHTENYENCFSDPQTGAFPPDPIPYLKGVPEGSLPAGFPSERALLALWNSSHPATADAWSPHFRWKVTISEGALEGHMHHVIDSLSADPEFAPFIEPPPSRRFGHIDRFEIVKRGVSGCAIAMVIHTSHGRWVVKKELVIRSVFKNPDVGLSRLKSARVVFEHRRKKSGLLSGLIVFGLGWGHGVGLQQTGAEGMAGAGKDYRQILAHYFPGTSIERAS
jgi:stage II sporulation protein D